MRKTSLPPLRVTPQFRKSIQAVLDEGESLSAFMLDAVAKKAEVRREQRAFVARAEARSREVSRTGKYVTGDAVFARLEGVLARAKRKAADR
jgi:hypothetical protein